MDRNPSFVLHAKGLRAERFDPVFQDSGRIDDEWQHDGYNAIPCLSIRIDRSPVDDFSPTCPVNDIDPAKVDPVLLEVFINNDLKCDLVISLLDVTIVGSEKDETGTPVFRNHIQSFILIEQ